MGPDPKQQSADAELIGAIARGDEQAFASLFDRYNSTLLGFLIRILNSEAEAQDVLQEVYIQVWQRASDYDELRGRVFTWLVTIARSRGIDRLRSLNARERTAMNSALEVVKDSSNADDAAVTGEQHEIVRRALEKIPEAQRDVLLLAYFEGLSQSDIAARAGIPLGTVKTRTRDGLRNLRRFLSKRLKENS